ncbi:lecithin retinol acyltransferase family protein [Aeromonas hydrophila]
MLFKERFMPLPQSGDHLVSPRTGYQHHGLYLGGHQVIHYQGVSAGIHSGQIAITTLAEFSQGRGYRIQHHSARAFNRKESITVLIPVLERRTTARSLTTASTSYSGASRAFTTASRLTS